jgi:hypothetical protein
MWMGIPMMLWFVSCIGQETFQFSFPFDVWSEKGQEVEDISFDSFTESCALGSQGNDPLTEVGSVFAQSSVFAELLDIAYDPLEEVIWGVGQGGVMLFDASDLSAPAFLRAYSPIGWHERAYHLVHTSDRLFVSHRNNGWTSYDIRDPLQANTEEFVTLLGAAGMEYESDILYVANRFGTVHIYDVSGIVPIEIQEVEGLANPWRMALSEEALYVADTTQGLVVLDISVPSETQKTTDVFGSGGLQDVVVGDGFLYAAAGGLGVDIFDILNPLVPEWIGNIPTSYPALTLAIDGQTLWVASQQDVIAIDVSDAENPIVHNTEKTRQWAMAVDAYGGYSFVADWGYVSILSLDKDVSGGDLHLASTQVFVGEGETELIALKNFGTESIDIHGGTSSHEDISMQISSVRIEPDETEWLSIRRETSAGGRLCLSSSDPDDPQQYIDIVGPEEYPIGTEAPDFTLQSLDGEIYHLQELYGSYVVLVYFATW